MLNCSDWLEYKFWKQATVGDVKRCLNAGKNTEDRSSVILWTRLHFAAAYSTVEVICQLLAQKADIEARSREEITPLHAAIRYSRTDNVRFLLKMGADYTARDIDGMAPIHWALKFNQDTSIIWELEKYQLNAGEKTKDGKYPYDLFLENKNLHYDDEILSLLKMHNNL